MTLLRKPLLHFIAIGVLLYVVRGFVFDSGESTFGAVAPDPDRETIVITAERIDEIRNDWLARTGLVATGQVIAAMVREEIEERLLVAEARRLGVHRNDPVIQRRLLQNMDFLGEEADGTAEEKLEAAFALNFDQSDLVVRRRMIQTMQLDAHAAARATEPTEAELAEHLAANAARFTQPARRRISHVYFSRDARGAATEGAAQQALAGLRSAGASPAEANELGDPFMFPRDLPSNSMAELAKTFGVNFAARAFKLPVGSWDGPVPSAYGEHLVFVHDETPARVPELESIRTQVREHLLGQRSIAAERALVARLRGEYEVVVEERAAEPGAAK